jgi:hypothetical protein
MMNLPTTHRKGASLNEDYFFLLIEDEDRGRFGAKRHVQRDCKPRQTPCSAQFGSSTMMMQQQRLRKEPNK